MHDYIHSMADRWMVASTQLIMQLVGSKPRRSSAEFLTSGRSHLQASEQCNLLLLLMANNTSNCSCASYLLAFLLNSSLQLNSSCLTVIPCNLTVARFWSVMTFLLLFLPYILCSSVTVTIHRPWRSERSAEAVNEWMKIQSYIHIWYIVTIYILQSWGVQCLIHVSACTSEMNH